MGSNTTIEYEKASEYFKYLNTLWDQSDEANRPRLSKRIGDRGFEVWFTSFDMTFKQGHIIGSSIEGGLRIPRLKDANGEVACIDIKGHLEDDGGFNVTASEQDGFAPITLEKVMDIYIKSLEVGRESSDEPFYIGTACDIVFTNEIIKSFIGDQKIEIERLRIYSDGSFEIVGGSIPVPQNFTLDLGPVQIAISNINYGAFQEEHGGQMRKYNYMGFDGAIDLGNLGVEARGKGVKFYFTVDDSESEGKDHHSYIKVETIEIDLTIPGNASPENAKAIIKGWLSISENEYAGGVSLKVPDLKIHGEAHMRLQPKYPAFVVDASIEDIPIPIPLGATGLGITGFRGLAGYRYVAEKEAIGLHSHDDKWYDYYTYPPRGVHLSKFHLPEKTENFTNPISLGAGITISNLGTNVIALRVMAMISIPNLLVIDGRGSILGKEWGLDDSGEPPFFAFMIIADNGIEIGAGLDFKKPSSGSLIDMHVYMQAGYFWDNPRGWYVNLGTREDPVTAKVLSLIDMESFIMLAARGIEAGARVSFDIKERFGPVKVDLWFLAEVGGFISFERFQIGGFMTVDAGGKADLFGVITVSVSFYVHFSVEAPKPFLIYAEIRVCGRIKIAFVKIKVCATIKMKWEKDRRLNDDPIPPLLPENRKEKVKGIHMLTGEPFELIDFGSNPPNANSSFNEAVIPLDTYIDIQFDKAVQPVNLSGVIGGYNHPPESHQDIIPPKKVIKGNELRQVTHKYQISNIQIKAAKMGSSTWVDYHPYEAVVNEDDRHKVDHLRIGHWQKSSKEYKAIRLLAESPFSYTQQGEPGWFVPEQIGLTGASFFCQAQFVRPKCIDWTTAPLGTTYRVLENFPYYYSFREVFFKISQGQESVVNGIDLGHVAMVVNTTNTFDVPRSLAFPNTSSMEFKLPEPSREVGLKLSSNAQGVRVVYYRSFLPEGAYQVVYLPVTSITYSPEDLADQEGIVYTNEEHAISKFEIFPISPIQSEVDAIYEQIEQLFEDTYEQLGEELPEEAQVEEPIDVETYHQLLEELEVLENQGCNTPFIPIEKGGLGLMQIQDTDFNEKRFEVGKRPPGLPTDGPCDLCDLEETLSDYYDFCFAEEGSYEVECLEDFINFVSSCGLSNEEPQITGILFPEGDCCNDNSAPTRLNITFPEENCCEVQDANNSDGNAFVSPLVSSDSGDCFRKYQFFISGNRVEEVIYGLEFTPQRGRNRDEIRVILDQSGETTVTVELGEASSAPYTDKDMVKLTIKNTSSSRSVATASFDLSNCQS